VLWKVQDRSTSIPIPVKVLTTDHEPLAADTAITTITIFVFLPVISSFVLAAIMLQKQQ
jgi:hypothetical protein